MYSNFAEILLNSVPVLPSSASLPELGRVLRIPAGIGGDWKVLQKFAFCMQKHFPSFCLIDLLHKGEGVVGQDTN